MSLKRFYKKSGYEGTIQALINDKGFIRGMKRESKKAQMLELLCQMEICRIEHGYYEELCYATVHCAGVPFCSKQKAKKIS